MSKINLSTGEVRPTSNLDALPEDVESQPVRTTPVHTQPVRTTISDTKISDTKKVYISDTNISDTDISDTNLSSTNRAVSDTNEGVFSDTNLSATKGQYMNRWKKENKDTIRFDMAKGGKTFLQRESAKRGLSVTKLIKDAIKEYLTNHPID